MMTNTKDWDNLFNTLVTYGQELLRYDEAYYEYSHEQIILSWKTGEDSGGDCWGGVSQYSRSQQKQPEFTILDELLFQLDPDIKLKDYRVITAKINMEETCNREYYGNGTYYNQFILEKEDLVACIEKAGYNVDNNMLKNITKHFEEKAYAYMESNKPTYNKNKW